MRPERDRSDDGLATTDADGRSGDAAVVEAARAWIDEHDDELFDLLAALVARPSYEGREGVHDDEGTTVGRLHAFLADRGVAPAPLDDPAADPRGAGLDAQRVPPRAGTDPPRENLYAILPGGDGGGLVCTSHTDTVPAGRRTAWPDGEPFDLRTGIARRTDARTIELTVGDERHERTIRDRLDRIWRERGVDEREVLVGCGAYDNKAAIVCLAGALCALDRALDEAGGALGGDLVHAHLVGEEIDHAGARRLVGAEGEAGRDESVPAGTPADGAARAPGGWLGARYGTESGSLDGFEAVVLEGSYGLVPVVAHRGLAWLTLRAEGEATHASTPELGRNAVLGLSRALDRLDGAAFAERLGEEFDDALLGEPTVAAGTTAVSRGVRAVDAGTGAIDRQGVNVVPDWCEATLDVRLPRWTGFPADPAALRRTLEAAVEETASTAAPEIGFEARLGPRDFYPPTVLAGVADAEAARDHPLTRAAAAATHEMAGYRPGVTTAPGVSDATILGHATPMTTLIEYGPAGALSHQPLEFVERRQLLAGAKALVRLAVDRLGVVDRAAVGVSSD